MTKRRFLLFKQTNSICKYLSIFWQFPFIRFLLFNVSYNLWNSSYFSLLLPCLGQTKKKKRFQKAKIFLLLFFKTQRKLFICFTVSYKSNFKTIITTPRQPNHFLRQTKVFLRGSNKSMKMTKVLSIAFLHSKQQVNTASKRRCSAI